MCNMYTLSTTLISSRHSGNSKKIQNGQLKKAHFPVSPILNIFSQKFHGLVLWLVELIDAKGIGVRYGCEAV